MTIDKCGKYVFRLIGILLLIVLIVELCQCKIIRTKVTDVDDDIVEFRFGTDYYGFYGDGFAKGESVTVFMYKDMTLGAWK